MSDTTITQILNQFESIYNGKPWIYDTFQLKLSHINEDNAFARPLPSLHSTGEIIWHLSNWKKEITHRLQGEKPKKVMEEWMSNDEIRAIGWKPLLEDFKDVNDEFIQVLAVKNDDLLDQNYFDPDYKEEKPFRFIVEGLLHHDLYHLGQLGIVIKFLNKDLDE